MKPSVCVIGAGRMGSFTTRAYLRNQYPTWVWNRTTARCEPQLTSGSQRLAREEAKWFSAHGAVYLNGTIMATPDFLMDSTDAK